MKYLTKILLTSSLIFLTPNIFSQTISLPMTQGEKEINGLGNYIFSRRNSHSVMKPKILIKGKKEIAIPSVKKYANVGPKKYNCEVTTKILENGISIREFDYGLDKNIELKIISQILPNGDTMNEFDIHNNKTIEMRTISSFFSKKVRIEIKQPNEWIKLIYKDYKN